LELSKMMVLTTKDPKGNPYTSNVYFWYNPENYTCYFISRKTREHSEHILENANIAWSIIDTESYDSTAPDKKALQIQGIAKMLEWEEAMKAYNSFYRDRIWFPNFPEWHFVFECAPKRVKNLGRTTIWMKWEDNWIIIYARSLDILFTRLTASFVIMRLH
jgi:uncharacterized protein YhbP (UPF0306 family)